MSGSKSDPIDCSQPDVHRISQASILEWENGMPFPAPGDLSKPGIEPASPKSQVDSLPLRLHKAPCICITLCMYIYKLCVCIYINFMYVYKLEVELSFNIPNVSSPILCLLPISHYLNAIFQWIAVC